ncbi:MULTISPECIES: GMC oxidoreductase [Streptomyces]|uniref:GMC family oxidoreductase N-terminal domain-containing protein n=1 Tax=Streptomyces edwardsiae TaxID=3075527 RepID=A0ABU2Q1H8_9ACTN|nr:GMC oxidoreductase [Streptomyces sp. DSM 41636]MDT0398278.1 GMC family oxidoreductase N-terminal domain-containing protein [Streptomyces sp. DSM 41636]
MSSRNLVDYIIVGNGAAGSALAHRLGANPQNRVLVIEAGGPDRQQRHVTPAHFDQASYGPHRYRHALRPCGADRVGERLTKWGTGGSTTVNAMLWGGGAGYEAWEAAGVTGWNGARIQAAFTDMERYSHRADGCRDSDGRREAEAGEPMDAASAWWIDALARQGSDAVEDLTRRAAYASRTASNGTRTRAARALLRGHVWRRPNVRVRLHCTARRILFDGTTATGVEAQTPRGTVRFTARREVIVCAGTVESPLLLQRSGVGDPELLTTAGVHLVAANPAVGGNLRQRRVAVLSLRLDGVPGADREPVTPAAQPRSRVTSLLRRSAAPPAHGGTAVLAVLSSDPGGSGPDMALQFTPVPMPDHDGASPGKDGAHGATVALYPRSPTSVGSVHITGPALEDPPRLVPGYLSTEYDKELTVAAFARVREILATEPIASVATETLPGPGVVDTAGVLRYVLDHGSTAHHEVGTCALGPGGAVDDELRVHGTHRLRVADASVMPTLTTGDTTAPGTAVGWIAGDLLRNANTQGR